MKNQIILITILIFLIAFTLRFWKLSEYPKSLSMDEVTIGYSAYSVLKTGKDEHGKFMPLVFKGMGDYKSPVNVYLNIPSILIFGLNEFAIRAPVALLGTFTCVLLVLLLLQIKVSTTGSLFAGFWLAISGWHIFYSRAGYEAITALFFLITGTYLFVKWTDNRNINFLSLSILSFSISAWAYHAERLLAPILFIFLVIFFKNKFRFYKKNIRPFVIPTSILLVFVIPFFYYLLTNQGIQVRAQELWITKDPTLQESLHKGEYTNLAEYLLDNDIYLVIRNWLGQYLSYYDLKFWFWKGVGITPENFQGLGLIYLLDLPIFFVGIYAFSKSNNKLLKNLTVFWFFAGGLPGSFARGDPNPTRALVFVPFFSFILASGADWVVNKVKARKIIIVYFLIAIVSVLYFYDLYIYNFHKYYSDLWHYGYKEVAQYVCQNYKKYETIIITDKYGIETPSIKTIPHYYILFHCQYDPGEFIRTRKLFNITGRQPHWRIDKELNNTLLIGSPWDFPEDFPKDKIMKKIYFLNGKPAFYLVET